MINEERFEFKVKLNLPKDVVLFSKLAENYESDIDVQSQDRHYVVDAKSFMGIFGLNLSNPLIVSTKNIEAGESFMNDVSDYVVHW